MQWHVAQALVLGVEDDFAYGVNRARVTHVLELSQVCDSSCDFARDRLVVEWSLALVASCCLCLQLQRANFDVQLTTS
jgi:hypothetical protein